MKETVSRECKAKCLCTVLLEEWLHLLTGDNTCQCLATCVACDVCVVAEVTSDAEVVVCSVLIILILLNNGALLRLEDIDNIELCGALNIWDKERMFCTIRWRCCRTICRGQGSRGNHLNHISKIAHKVILEQKVRATKSIISLLNNATTLRARGERAAYWWNRGFLFFRYLFTH